MQEIDFMSVLHKSTKRDYLARVNDTDYPKYKAAELAKKFDYDYWDGDRRICYGGYKYIPKRWSKVAARMIDYYQLSKNPKILDIGCGKGYLLYDFKQILPDAEIYGVDISKYAIKNSKPEISKFLTIGNSNNLKWEDNFFDLVISINTLHCLENYDLEKSLKEIIDHGFSIKYFRNHSNLCLAGEDKEFISKFMTKSGQSIFKPALAKDIFNKEDFIKTIEYCQALDRNHNNYKLFELYPELESYYRKAKNETNIR